MIVTAIFGMIIGQIPLPHGIVSGAPSIAPTFGQAVFHLKDINTAQLWMVVLTFLLVTFFDTAGTLIGMTEQAGMVDKDGKIESIYLDTTYKTKDGKETTKKALGNDYNMKTYNPSAAGEWFEQVEKLEKAIVENQGVDFIELKEDNTTDAVSGCTIKINALVAAAEKAISDARNPKAE